MPNNAMVAIFMGSASDEELVAPAAKVLKDLEIPYKITVTSAHRTAARTIRPVIGIPLTASALGGMDALLATVQMPPGYPVATVALDKAGSRNAAWLAAQILALNNRELAARLKKARAANAEAVEKAARELEDRFKP